MPRRSWRACTAQDLLGAGKPRGNARSGVAALEQVVIVVEDDVAAVDAVACQKTVLGFAERALSHGSGAERRIDERFRVQLIVLAVAVQQGNLHKLGTTEPVVVDEKSFLCFPTQHIRFHGVSLYFAIRFLEDNQRVHRDDPTGASDAARQAEAARRAARELARRVERQTGRRPAEATIRRAAREDRLPRGADPVVLARQARIDRAGGITALARQLGTTAARITRWRDNPAARLPTAAQAPTVRVGVEVIGTVIVNGNEYPDKRIPENSKTALSYLDLPVDSPIWDGA